MRILKSRKTETSISSAKEIEYAYPCEDCIVKTICRRDLFIDSCDEYFEWFVDNITFEEEEDGNES